MEVVLSVNVMSSLLCFVILGPASLRSRRLEEVSERENGSARGVRMG